MPIQCLFLGGGQQFLRQLHGRLFKGLLVCFCEHDTGRVALLHQHAIADHVALRAGEDQTAKHKGPVLSQSPGVQVTTM